MVPPKDPGFYWVKRTTDNEWEIVYVGTHGMITLGKHDFGTLDSVFWKDATWVGPIKEPVND